MASAKDWHRLTPAEAMESLASDRRGLSPEEASRRFLQFGPNELEEKKKISPWKILLEQFKSFLIIILIVAAVVSGVLAILGEGDIWDPILIMVIVLMASILGFVQEYRSERALEALKRMAALTGSVLRGGEEVEIPSREIVPGDVVLLSSGDRVPADLRLFEVAELRVDEAPLTGESLPVEKSVEPLPEETALAERRSMAYTGTTVAYGRGKGFVVGTAMATEFGKIAGMLQEVEAGETPLQRNLDKVGKVLGIAAIVVCFVVGGLYLLKGLGILDVFIWSVSLAVAAVPEALPAVVTITLAIGVQRMVRRHALVRKLPSVETLGCTTVICSDKTGTLSQGEMTVRKLYVNGQVLDVSGVGYEPKGDFYLDGVPLDPQRDEHVKMALRINTLCNDSHLVSVDGTWRIKGDPTEGALAVVAAKGGQWQEELNKELPRIDELPFSSERKRMTTIHAVPEGYLAYSKGAPEVILDSCTRIYKDGEERALDAKGRDEISGIAQKMAGEALRVLGMAYKRLSSVSKDEAERDMVFAGLAGMIDPPRAEVKDAIKCCDRAGIKSVMITGDHKLTAMAIAQELGLMKNGVALTGAELDNMSDEEFDDMVEKVEVYARVSPAHKMRIVDALAKRGHVVAMTGDGVNDAPALKKADIGIAMGITGTDVTKETADMVLTDDNFASIVAAVEEGRAIFANIKKFLVYLLSCNVGEILLMVFAVIAGIAQPPLIAVQLLWVNLTTDGFPALALAVDPPEPDIMGQPPRLRKEGVFSKPVLRYIAVIGVWTGLVSFGVFYWAIHSGKSGLEASSLCFATMIFLELFNAFNCRSERFSLFKVGLFKNRWLIIAVTATMLVCLPLFYVPFLQTGFDTYRLTLTDWAIVIGAAFTIIPAAEIIKLIGRRSTASRGLAVR